jgi:release factor glutamine methyltransferase
MGEATPLALRHGAAQKVRTRRQAFAGAAGALRAAGKEMPELDARLLLCHAAGLNHEAYVASPDVPLSEDAASHFDAMIERRLKGEPVSRILGAKEFYGRSFAVDVHTLDPRPDTETLIEAVLDTLAREGRREEKLRILDLGTGTGCILLTLLAELPLAQGVGSDVSAGALDVARRNVRDVGVGDRASFVAGDWFKPIEGSFDIVVSNPPYIASAEIARLSREVGYDPLLALDGGEDGLEAYRRIASGVARVLCPGGLVFLEIGETQGEAVLGLLRDAGLEIEAGRSIWADLAGRQRCVGVRLG